LTAHFGKFVAYYRVSTDKQGQSGLGLDAQRKAVIDYLDGGKWTLLDEFTEIESGKRNDRPELEKALAACKKHRAKLVIAKLGPHQSRARGRQGQRQEAWQLPAHRRSQAARHHSACRSRARSHCRDRASLNALCCRRA
jgi:Resolvase, N terminal domain